MKTLFCIYYKYIKKTNKYNNTVVFIKKVLIIYATEIN